MSRVLLVEDDPDVRLILEGALFNAGYDVKAAANVRDGLSLLDSREFDLLLTDGRLPDGTGIELADTAGAKGTPVVILMSLDACFPLSGLVTSSSWTI